MKSSTYRTECGPSSQRFPRTRKPRRRPPLQVELLESRLAPAVITVANLADDTLANLAGDGQLALREALEVANNPGTTIDGFSSPDDADTIQFAAGLTGAINLQAGQLGI